MNSIIKTLFCLFGKTIESYGKYTISHHNGKEILLMQCTGPKHMNILDSKVINGQFPHLTLSQKQTWNYSKKFQNSNTNRKINSNGPMASMLNIISKHS